MFSYLRYFSVVSFVVVMVAAVSVGIYFRQIAAGDLKTIVEQGNVSLSQGFINTTWKKHAALFQELSRVDVPKWARYPAFIEFSRDAFRYFEEIPVTKLNVYTASGKRFLSTNQTEISFFSAENTPQNRMETYREGFQMALKGEVYSRIVPEGQYQALDGTTRTAALVQSFVPIISDRYVSIVADTAPEVEAVIEVFYDVTPQWEQLWLFQALSTGGIVVIFLILFAALMYTSHKAEGIIAKQHDSNLELTAAKARAEAANREKSKFLANISHELRTPLNAIIGFSEIIKNEMMGDLGNPQYIDYINDIHSSGVHLLSLINDILDYSKAEAGKLELEVSEMDATKLIKTSIRLVSPRAESAEVKLVDQTPKEHFVINSDAKKFKQVLLNLLSNAVKFTPPGGEVRVAAWQNVANGAITVEVTDTGIGIAPKDISKAMAPFGQVDSDLSRRYEGTGLGLPLTKRLVEVMGGTFDIKSELKVGTTVTFSIPREAPEEFRKKASSAPVAAAPISIAAKPVAPGPAAAIPLAAKSPPPPPPPHAPVALSLDGTKTPPIPPILDQNDPFKSYAPRPAAPAETMPPGGMAAPAPTALPPMTPDPFKASGPFAAPPQNAAPVLTMDGPAPVLAQPIPVQTAEILIQPLPVIPPLEKKEGTT